MKIKIKDIELDLPNDVGLEISEDGKRIVVSQPPNPVQWFPSYPFYPQPIDMGKKPFEITWTPNYTTCAQTEATK